ncbi:hypothetical protein FKV88_03200 [Weissella paramesenteroides]|nr:hypothetical protein FKV86_05940 [Weissella paramesenteroides]KAA8457339.1 hypothetical protein FKV78_06200 [Weissella paramesenteroides]KAA8459895.1 hypothetical protein FKV82_04155 [Weissella paramesenteroides]KAA8462427.1 hypothetical protein FKV85_05415 [Weissella paramesenteroides]KAA8463743.1 hypothetical protein FKV80_03925 [Weissella paramesenteroides]
MIAGQSLISWCLQLILIYLAWEVADHKIANNLYTISGAAVLLILIYLSLAHDNRQRQSKK